MKQVLLFIIAITAMQQSIAQLEVTDTNNITRERWRDSVFRMDKNQVPTGFLLEYSMFGMESNKYDGVGNDDDTIKNDGRILELHNIMWYSKVNNNATIDLTDSMFSKAFFANLNSDVIPLTFIYQNYNRIRQSSLTEGLFSITPDSVGIIDVPGRPASPYDNYELFAFAPFKIKIIRFNAIPFTLPNELFYMQGLTNVEIDFDDGAGFRSLAKGSAVNIYYATEGLKYLTAKITTVNGIRTAKCMIDYKRPAVYVQSDYSGNIEVDPAYTNDNQYLGGNNLRTGELINPCEYGSLSDLLLCATKPNAFYKVENGCDRVFDKPIIVVEGFDPTGDLTIAEMQSRFSQHGFIETMKAYGYDFVFIDFTKNHDYIENNAKVLEAVINWVNQNKVGNFKSTVIGYSMGGLIARWCLKDMEDRGLQHNVENYFSYDAPHQGANIPLGMQYIFKELVRDLPYLRWNSDLRKLDDADKSPAAKQMLVTYADYNNGPFNWFPNLNTLNNVRAAFASRLKAKGYPQQTRNFGIAFGRGDNIPNTKIAGNGNQFTPANPFHPKDDIFWGSLFTILVNLEAQASAVPENNEKATIGYYSFFGITFRKIFGLIPRPVVTLRVRRFDYTGRYSYDDAIGSFDVTQSIVESSWLGSPVGSATTFGHDGHNFVATASALDLQNQGYGALNNWQSNNMFFNIDNQIQNIGQINGNTLINPTLSPFRSVITSTTESPFYGWNIWHNDALYSHFAEFIERNILNAQPVNCDGTNGLCNSNPAISGPQAVCSTAQYTITDFPQGVNVVWQTQNGNLQITNGQGTPTITVSSINAGSEVITATITNACGISMVLTVAVFSGLPTTSTTISPYGGENNCYELNHDYRFEVTNPESSVQYYTWGYQKWDGTTVILTEYGSTLSPPNIFYNEGSYTVFATPRNECGAGSRGELGIYVNPWWQPCDGYQYYSLAVSPNPTQGDLNVSIVDEKPEIKALGKNENVQISLYEFNTHQMVKQWQFKNDQNKFKLNVAGLRKGQYIIQVKIGKYGQAKQIIVN